MEKFGGFTILGIVMFLLGMNGYSQPTEIISGQGLTAKEHLSKGNSAYGKKQFEQAISHYVAAADLFKQQEQWEDYVDCSNGLYFLYYSTDQFKPMGDVARELAHVSREKLGIQSPSYKHALNNLGTYYNLIKGDFEAAIGVYKEAIELAKSSNDLIERAELHNNLGYVYKKQGEFAEALAHHNFALQLRKDTLGQNHKDIADALFIIARGLEDLEQNEEAMGIYHEILALPKKQRSEDTYIESLLYSIDIAIQWEDLEYAARNFHLLDKQNVQASYQQIKRNELLGAYHRAAGTHHEASNYFRKALTATVARRNAQDIYKHPSIALAHLRLAETFAEIGQADSCFHHLQAGLAAVSWEFDGKSPTGDPDIADIWFSAEALSILKTKSDQLKARQQLEAAYSSIRLSTEMIPQIRKGFLSNQGKLDLSSQGTSIYERAIALAFELYESTGDESYLGEAFGYMESVKSMLLDEELQAAGALEELPAETRQKVENSRLEWSFFEEKLFELKQKNSQEEQVIVDLEKKVFELQQTYQAEVQMLQSAFPKYYEQKYDHKVPSLQEIQALLPSQTALIEYFWGNAWLYAICIQKNKVQYARIPLLNREMDQIKYMMSQRDAVLQKGYGKAAFEHFVETVQELHKQMIYPLLGEDQPEKLIVVPDGKLAYLPFELLISSNFSVPTEVNYYELPYLFKSSVISYQYAARHLLLEKKGSQNAADQTYLGIAPHYVGNKQLSQQLRSEQIEAPLFHHTEEVSFASNLFNGKALIAEAANERNFLQEAPAYRILHLATHAVLNDQNPLYAYFLLSPEMASTVEAERDREGILYASEIYNLDLNAELAVLSACYTGDGALQKGEGVMSMARAFVQAGCSNLVMSLWQADDLAVAKLTRSFYQYLYEGYPKDKALQLARIDYLETADQSHPHFWASLILIGNGDPMFGTSRKILLYWIIGLILSAFICVGVLWRRKFRK